MPKSESKPHYYLIGGGIAALNTALLLLRKGISGSDITIFDENPECGGLFYRDVSADGKSFFAHTVRTFDEPSYRYTRRAWKQAGIWNKDHLIHRNLSHPRETIPADMRQTFLAIARKSDEELDKIAISTLLPQKILASAAFRYFFHLTGLAPHHSALALKRYMTHTHGNIPHNWVLRAANCDFDSIIDPIVKHLKTHGVHIENNKKVERVIIDDNNHVTHVDNIKLQPNDRVIVTLGANVEKDLIPQDVLRYSSAVEQLVAPTTPFQNSTEQPHSSVWLLVPDDVASQIEAKFPGSNVRDFIHIDVTHPWQITLISLGDQYYKGQPPGTRLFYLPMNDLSKEGKVVTKKGTECNDEELKQKS